MIHLITRHAYNAERKGCRMKIEKVNENQIRCTLTREDLVSRELKISELAYGTEKAKTLFRDMMRQANFEFGFEAEDIPLMIEAIPLNAECIVLIITKVEDPEELDTRFSRFAPSVTEEDDGDEEYSDHEGSEVMDLFRQIQAKKSETASDHTETDIPEGEVITRIFLMSTLQQVMNVCQLISSRFVGESTLYKDASTGNFFLLLAGSAKNRTDFDRICNIVSEYGTLQRSQPSGSSFLDEHCEVLIRSNAVNSLGNTQTG